MKKAGIVVGMTFGLILVYVLLIAVHPAIAGIVDTANTSITAPGQETVKAAINAFPLYIWFLPFLLYIIAIAMVLRADDSTLE